MGKLCGSKLAPHLQGPATVRKLKTSLSLQCHPHTTNQQCVCLYKGRLPYWTLNGFLHLEQLRFLGFILTLGGMRVS